MVAKLQFVKFIGVKIDKTFFCEHDFGIEKYRVFFYLLHLRKPRVCKGEILTVDSGPFFAVQTFLTMRSRIVIMLFCYRPVCKKSRKLLEEKKVAFEEDSPTLFGIGTKSLRPLERAIIFSESLSSFVSQTLKEKLLEII